MNDRHDWQPDDTAPEGAGARAIVRHLDRRAANLPPAIGDALQSGRHKALVAARVASAQPRKVPSGTWLTRFGGLPVAAATVFVLAVTAMVLLPVDGPQNVATPLVAGAGMPDYSLDHVGLLAAEDGLEFYQSVDFLLWLESREG